MSKIDYVKGQTILMNSDCKPEHVSIHLKQTRPDGLSMTNTGQHGEYHNSQLPSSSSFKPNPILQ